MLGLTLEGGASRTVYSCGIMDALLENKIIADYVIGVSAGAAFGVSYCSGQIGRNLRLATEFMGTKKYMGARHLIDPKNRCYYNLDYAYNVVPNVELPFDYEAYRNFKGRFCAVVTNVKNGKAEYMDVPKDDTHWNLLRATCALPLLFPEIEINGEKYSKIAIYFLVVYLAFFSILQYDYINITKGELINVKKSISACKEILEVCYIIRDSCFFNYRFSCVFF